MLPGIGASIGGLAPPSKVFRFLSTQTTTTNVPPTGSPVTVFTGVDIGEPAATRLVIVAQLMAGQLCSLKIGGTSVTTVNSAGNTRISYVNLTTGTLVFALSDQCEAASSGDLKRGEALLTAQAHTLDAIFNNLARKAARCEYLNQAEVNLRLALKAQSQCRATLETLAAIKNPQPVAFVKQANIAHGPQQVNNEVAQPSRASHARKGEKQPNKLLETPNEKPLDTGAQGATGFANPALETVGAIDRSKDRRG